MSIQLEFNHAICAGSICYMSARGRPTCLWHDWQRWCPNLRNNVHNLNQNRTALGVMNYSSQQLCQIMVGEYKAPRNKGSRIHCLIKDKEQITCAHPKPYTIRISFKPAKRGTYPSTYKMQTNTNSWRRWDALTKTEEGTEQDGRNKRTKTCAPHLYCYASLPSKHWDRNIKTTFDHLGYHPSPCGDHLGSEGASTTSAAPPATHTGFTTSLCINQRNPYSINLIAITLCCKIHQGFILSTFTVVDGVMHHSVHIQSTVGSPVGWDFANPDWWSIKRHVRMGPLHSSQLAPIGTQPRKTVELVAFTRTSALFSIEK